MPTTATAPGEQTVTASLSKPDADPNNDSSTSVITVLPSCQIAYDAGSKCAAGFAFDASKANKSLADNTAAIATFNATCCVSFAAAHRRFTVLHASCMQLTRLDSTSEALASPRVQSVKFVLHATPTRLTKN